MALTTCPDCGHSCSALAVACPSCGRPIIGSVTPPAVTSTIASLAAVPRYGTSMGASILIALSALCGLAGLAAELTTGRPSFGTYLVAILFGVWSRLAQAHAHHRAIVDALARRE
jgi:hypothetical protein